MKRMILLLAATAMLGACGHGRGASEVETGGPKPVKGMDWTFAPVDNAAALTYGAPGGGGVKLMLACAKRSGVVMAGEPVAALPEGSKTLVLVSGSVKSSSLGAVQASPSDPELQVLASKFSTMDPIIQAFANRGWISVPGERDRLAHMAPQPGNRAVKEFFAFCG